MTRSALELAVEEFIRKTSMSMSTLSDATNFRLISIVNGLMMGHQDVMNDLSSQEGEAAEALLLSQINHNLTPTRNRSNSTLDPQSSICGDIPKAKIREINEVIGATSASSLDHQSDDEETDAAQSEQKQSLDPSILKRLRRMLSNRESARRSRKRKQEHLTDLELMAEEMRGENDSLYKRLTNAHQQFRDADTYNRVLKSDVEALRAKVKLAEDMLAGGSLTCGNLNQLMTSPYTIATHNHSVGRVPNVSPTITIHGDDSPYSGFSVYGDISNANANLNNGFGGDTTVSCVSEIWR